MKRRDEQEPLQQAKTYLCVIIGNEQVLSRVVVIAYNIFDAMVKCSARFGNENVELSSLTLQVEEAEVIR